jgi:hypothetical protein
MGLQISALGLTFFCCVCVRGLRSILLPVVGTSTVSKGWVETPNMQSNMGKLAIASSIQAGVLLEGE